MDQSARQVAGESAERLLLHHRFAQTHVDRALDLPQDENRVDRASDVVSDPNMIGPVETGLGVDLDLDHGGGVGVGRRRADPCTPVLSRCPWWDVRAGGAESAPFGFGNGDGVLEAQSLLRIGGIEDPPLGEDQSLPGHLEPLGHRLGYELSGPLGSLMGGMADHQGHPRGVTTQVDWCQIGIRHTKPDVAQIDTQDFGDHGCQHRVGALTDLGFAAEDGHTPRAIEL